MRRNCMPKPGWSSTKGFVVRVVIIDAEAEAAIHLKMNMSKTKKWNAELSDHPVAVDVCTLSNEPPHAARAWHHFGAKQLIGVATYGGKMGQGVESKRGVQQPLDGHAVLAIRDVP